MYKNISGQKVAIYAHDTSADAPKTGDAANITAYISKDGGAATQSNDINPTELDATNMKGIYIFDTTQAETNCDLFMLSAVSSTSGIQIEPVIIYTIPSIVPADMVEISGDSGAADNLEATFDGTGYSDPEAPATQAQLANIGSVGGVLNAVAESFNLITGVVASGDYTDTTAVDQVYHQIQDSGGVINCSYQFDVGHIGIAAGVTIVGRINSKTDDLIVYAWNWGSSIWEKVVSYIGQNSSTDVIRKGVLLARHTGTGANLGKVQIRFYGTGLTNANLYIDQIFLTYGVVMSSTGYSNGAIWVMDGGSSGTEVGVDGIADNPCTWAAALTLNSALGLNRFHIANGSTITLTSSADNYTFVGEGYTINLNGQSIANAYFENGSIYGTSSGTSYRMVLCKVAIAGAISVAAGGMKECAFGDSGITLNAAGTYIMTDCFVVDEDAYIDMETDAEAKTVFLSGQKGDIEFRNFGNASANHKVVVTGQGEFKFNSNCNTATATDILDIHGLWTIDDNVSGGWGGTIYEDTRIDRDAINAEADTALADYDPPTRAEATSDKDEIIAEINANEVKIDAIDACCNSVLSKTRYEI